MTERVQFTKLCGWENLRPWTMFKKLVMISTTWLVPHSTVRHLHTVYQNHTLSHESDRIDIMSWFVQYRSGLEGFRETNDDRCPLSFSNQKQQSDPISYSNYNYTYDNTRCDPKVFRWVVLREYCALHLAADSVTT